MATNAINSQVLEGGIKAFIVQAIQEILQDPDFGLELTERAKGRLRQAFRKQKTTSLVDIKKKYY